MNVALGRRVCSTLFRQLRVEQSWCRALLCPGVQLSRHLVTASVADGALLLCLVCLGSAGRTPVLAHLLVWLLFPHL